MLFVTYIIITILFVIIWVGFWNLIESLKYAIFGKDSMIANLYLILFGASGLYILSHFVNLKELL